MRKVTINSRKSSKKDATTCIQGDMGHKTPSDAGFRLIYQIAMCICRENEVVMDPYARPLHMKVVKHLVYV